MEDYQKKEKGTTFQVKLDGIELPEGLRNEINEKIQITVMESLGKLDNRLKPSTDGKVILTPAKFIFNKDWYGLWVRLFKQDLVSKFVKEDKIQSIVVETPAKSIF